MPFTLSHAAAALPLQRLGGVRLPLAALMIGTLVPDFLYFLPYQPRWLQSHSLAGLFYFCWPVGLLAWLVYVRFLQRPTLALLPDRWRGALPVDVAGLDARRFALISLTLLLGAITHIVWDAFTHPVPLAVDWPVLRTPLFEIHGRPKRLWWLLQHLSTVFGAGVLWMWALRRRDSAPAVDAADLPRLDSSTRRNAACIIAAATVLLAALEFHLHPSGSFQRRLFHLAIGGMAGGALAWCGVSAWVSRRRS